MKFLQVKYLRVKFVLLAVLGVGLTLQGSLLGNPSALRRPSLEEILKGQGWDKLADWRQREEQAENHVSFGDWKEAHRLYGQAAQMVQARKGGLHPLVLRLKAAQARCQLYMEQVDAGEKKLREILATQEQRLGNEHAEVLTTRHWLALAKLFRNEVEQAEKEFRQVARIRARILGEEHEDTLSSRSNLAYALDHLGRMPEAEPEWRAAAGATAKLHGEDDMHALELRTNLASCLQRQGKTGEALAEFRKVLELRRKALGLRHDMTLDAWRLVASSLSLNGDHAAAAKEFLEAAVFIENWLGNEQLAPLLYRQGAAEVLELGGRFEDAWKEWQLIRERQEKIMGRGAKEVIATKMAINDFLMRWGKHDEVEKGLRDLIQQAVEESGAKDRNVLLLRRSLAECLRNGGKVDESVALYRELLNLFDREFSKEQKEIPWMLRTEMARALQAQGRLGEAKDLLADAAFGLRMTVGPQAEETLRARMQLAGINLVLGDVRAANEMQQETLEVAQRVFTEKHQLTLEARCSVVMAAIHQGFADVAEREARVALKTAPEVMGPKHAVVDSLWLWQGKALVMQERFEEAEKCIRTSLQIRRERSGEAHEDAWLATVDLINLMILMKRLKEARQLLDECEAQVLKRFKKTDDLPMFLQSRRAMLWSQEGRRENAERLFATHAELVKSCGRPVHGQGWIIHCRAENLHELKRHKEAEELLKPVMDEMSLRLAHGTKELERTKVLYQKVRKALGNVEDPGKVTGRVTKEPATKANESAVVDEQKKIMGSIFIRSMRLDKALELSRAGRHVEAKEAFKEVLQMTLQQLPATAPEVGPIRLHLWREGLLAGQGSTEELDDVLNWMGSVNRAEGDGVLHMLLDADGQMEARGKNAEVQKFWQRVIDRWNRTLKSDDVWRRTAQFCHLGSKRRAAPGTEAIKLECGQMLKTLTEALGANHRLTLQCRLTYADELVIGMEGAKAQELLDGMDAALEKEFGLKSREVFSCRQMRVFCMSQSGMGALAAMEMRMVCSDAQRELGGEHEVTLNMKSSLAGLLEGAQQWAEAEQVRRELLETVKEQVGVSPVLVKSEELKLAGCIASQGRLNEALEMIEKSLRAVRSLQGVDAPLVKQAEDMARRIRLAKEQTQG